MPIKNYTTKVPADRSIQEIQTMLLKHGATDFLYSYEDGRIKALKFILPFNGKSIPFQLPVDWRAFQRVLQDQGVKRLDDEDYCYRVAWRVLRDWVDAQMALFETQMVTIPQIFLPYAVTSTGETMYEKALNNPLFLGEGK
jgi:hypothetical protein